MQMSNDLQRPRPKVNELAPLYKTCMQVMSRLYRHMCYGILRAMKLLIALHILCLAK